MTTTHHSHACAASDLRRLRRHINIAGMSIYSFSTRPLVYRWCSRSTDTSVTSVQCKRRLPARQAQNNIELCSPGSWMSIEDTAPQVIETESLSSRGGGEKSARLKAVEGTSPQTPKISRRELVKAWNNATVDKDKLRKEIEIIPSELGGVHMDLTVAAQVETHLDNDLSPEDQQLLRHKLALRHSDMRDWFAEVLFEEATKLHVGADSAPDSSVGSLHQGCAPRQVVFDLDPHTSGCNLTRAWIVNPGHHHYEFIPAHHTHFLPKLLITTRWLENKNKNGKARPRNCKEPSTTRIPHFASISLGEHHQTITHPHLFTCLERESVRIPIRGLHFETCWLTCALRAKRFVGVLTDSNTEWYHALSFYYRFQKNDFAKTLENCQLALSLADSDAHPTRVGYKALNGIALLLGNTGNPLEGKIHAEKALKYAEYLGDIREAVHENLDKALFHLSKSVSYPRGFRYCDMVSGSLDLRNGNMQSAKLQLLKCLAYFWNAAEEGTIACLTQLADLQHGLHDLETTFRWTGIFLAFALKNKNKLGTMDALRCFGKILVAQGDDGTA
ncbi:hypothetical protein C8R44DRAFT_750872 [Mycena epipterygia]|nr:hypothetical protein C8R44DRAFT_750872 [Mycena epipterygia]